MSTRPELCGNLSRLARLAEELMRLDLLAHNDLYIEATRQGARNTLKANLREIARLATASVGLVVDPEQAG